MTGPTDTAPTIAAWWPVLATLAALGIALGLTLRFAIPRGHRRPVRAKVLLRALLPTRIVRSASGRADIAWFLFNVLLMGSAFGWTMLSGSWFAARFGGGLTALFGAPTPSAIPGWAADALMTVALFLAYEFAYWLHHGLSHRIGWLWEFHKVHHTAESLTPLTNFRVHPVDTIIFYNIAAAIGGLTMALAGYGLGRHSDGLSIGGLNALTFLATILFSYLQHSHLWISLPGRAGLWLLSPAHHQIHHSVEERHHGRNFGSTLAVFDRLFGTLHRPTARRETLRFGVDGLGYDPHSPTGAVLMPFAEAVRPVGAALAQSLRTNKKGGPLLDRLFRSPDPSIEESL